MTITRRIIYISVSFLLCSLSCISPAMSQGVPEEQLRLEVEKLQINNETRIKINAKDWLDWISQLSKLYGIKVVSYIPAHPTLQSTDGDLINHLSSIISVTNSRIRASRQSLSIGAPLGLSGDRIESYVGKPDLQDVEEELAISFAQNRIQLQRFQKGEGIPVTELSDTQLNLIKRMFSESGRERDFDHFLKSGQITSFIALPIPPLFVKGMNIHGEFAEDTAFKQMLEETITHRQGRSLDELSKATSIVFEKLTDIVITGNQTLTASEAFEKLSNLSGKDIGVAAPLKKKTLIVSQGNYTAFEFAALILSALSAEMRMVGGKIYIGPQTLPSNIDEDKPFIGEAEAFWKAIQPLNTALLDSPLSKLAPFTRSILSEPKLIPLASLSEEQRNYALNYNRIKEPALLKYDKYPEVFAAPMIEVQVSYTNAEGQKGLMGRGFTPRFYYSWLWLHTRG